MGWFVVFFDVVKTYGRKVERRKFVRANLAGFPAKSGARIALFAIEPRLSP